MGRAARENAAAGMPRLEAAHALVAMTARAYRVESRRADVDHGRLRELHRALRRAVAVAVYGRER